MSTDQSFEQHPKERPSITDWASAASTFFGAGLLPIAPGTWASAIASIPAMLAIAGVVPQTGVPGAYLLTSVICLVVGLIAIPRVQGRWGSDPSAVVIDEVVGMALLCATPYVYLSLWHLLAGFLVFRLFDIRKPWPCSWFNNRHEAWSVIADDVMAAIYTIVVMHLSLLAFTALGVVLVAPETFFSAP